MISNQLYRFLALAACSLLLVQQASADANEAEELGNQLYGNEVEMGPEQTLSSLKRLAELYAAGTDRVSHIRAKRTQLLIEACDSSPSQCSHTESVRMYKLIRNNSRFVKNIVPYLESCQAKKFAECKSQVESRLAERVKQVKAEDKALAKQLVDSFPASSKKENTDDLFKFVPIKALKESLLAVLRSRKSFEANVEYGRKRFEEEDFRRLFSQPCERIRTIIGDSLDYFDPMLDTRALTSQIDNETLDWMAVNNICWTIHRNTRLLIRETFKGLKLKDVKAKNPHF